MSVAEMWTVERPLGTGAEATRARWPAAWRWAKRALDVTAAAVLLVALVPLLIAVAIAIKLDSPGPVMFRQRRVGFRLRPFTMLKFRTMHDGASCELHRRYIARLAAHDPAVMSADLKKRVDDPRMTDVGRFLRKYSLDELPQLVHVVTGRMSLIGPRPAIEYELEHYDPRHFDRFTVLPGLSGLWQVSGRNHLGFIEMLDLDVEYARSCGPATDLRVLVKTPQAMVRGAV